MSDEETLFEAWFQTYKRRTFGEDSPTHGYLSDHPHWSMGFRDTLREGWMARAGSTAAELDAARRCLVLMMEKHRHWVCDMEGTELEKSEMERARAASMSETKDG